MSMYFFRFHWFLLNILFIGAHSLHLNAQPEIENLTIGQNAANWTDGDGLFVNSTMRIISHKPLDTLGGKCKGTKILFIFHGPMGDYKDNWAKIKEQFGIDKLVECGALV